MSLPVLLNISLCAVSLLHPAAKLDTRDLLTLLHSDKAAERLSAVRQLANRPPTPEISDALVTVLTDEDTEVVQTTVVLWGKIAEAHNNAYQDTIPTVGRKHTKGEVYAARQRWETWQNRLLTRLGRVIDSEDNSLSKVAARSLALMGPSVENCLFLQRSCLADTEAFSLSNKADGRFAEKTASREPLLHELFRDRDPKVVAAAFLQLYKISPKWLASRYSALARDSRHECRELVACYGPESLAISLIGDPEKAVRFYAVMSINDKAAVLEQLMPRFDEGTAAFRLGILDLVHYSLHEAPDSLIERALLDGNGLVRAAGIKYALQHNFDVPETYIRTSLKDSSVVVRRPATGFLNRLSPSDAQVLATGLLSDSDSQVREFALDYFISNPSLKHIPALIAAYRRDRLMSYYNLVLAIRAVGPPAEIHVRKMLTDPSPRIRQVGIWCANEVLGTAAIEPLIAATNDAAPSVRIAAATWLSGLSDARIPSIITRMLSDKDRDVVLAAMDTAEKANIKETLNELRRLESSEDDGIYERARQVMTTLNGVPSSGNDW